MIGKTAKNLRLLPLSYFVFFFCFLFRALQGADTLEIYQFVAPLPQPKLCSLEVYQFVIPPVPEKLCSLEVYQFSIPPVPEKLCSLEVYQFGVPSVPAKLCSLEIYQFGLPPVPGKLCSLEVYQFSAPPVSVKPCSLEIYQFTAPTGSRITVTISLSPARAGSYSVDASAFRDTTITLWWIPGTVHRLTAREYNFIGNRWFYKFKKWTSSRGAETTSLEWNVAPSDSVTYTAHFELYPIIRLHDNVWFDRDGNYRGFMLER